MRRYGIAMVVLAVVAMFLTPAMGSAAPGHARPPADDTREFSAPRAPGLVTTARGLAAEKQTPVAKASVGDTRFWLGYDDYNGLIYPKEYTLRGVGDRAEVWVATGSDDVSTGLDFPAGDCRNDGSRTVVTDRQVRYLLNQFDGNIFPTESALYSVAPPRDGQDAPLAEALGLPADYYAGRGKAIVILVDNFRDANFYDTNNANTYSYIAGFYWDLYDYYLNRLVMNIDGWDWLHRTGGNPPNDPSDDTCTNAPAHPYLYEATFAHEYQHLLESYQDWNEVSWVNEGLSMYAEPADGYADWAIPVTDTGFEGSVQCFMGWVSERTAANRFPYPGGPENSLTLWGDQTDDESEILCDYGAVGMFMGYLAQQYGVDFLSRLHTNKKNGIDGLQDLLDRMAGGVSASRVIDRWAAMVALDGALDEGATLFGAPASRYQLDLIHGSINWSNDQAYENPGAPPNGSDYVRLMNGAGQFLRLQDVRSIRFRGARQLPSLPVEWTVDAANGSPPPALYSGQGDNLDRAIAREVQVADGALTFEGRWNTEEGYDYAYVQVSADGGETYESVPCTDSVSAPLGPGFEGDSAAFKAETCDLSAYAGQTVLLSFRYVTDPGVTLPGFWVDNVVLDGTTVSDGSTLEGWSSPTEINPIDVEGFTVQLISMTRHDAHVATLPLSRRFEGFSGALRLHELLGRSGLVAAIVTYHDRTETVTQAAPYVLRVNGTVQPGGS
jgi:Immune inhibitor A-like, MAM domain